MMTHLGQSEPNWSPTFVLGDLRIYSEGFVGLMDADSDGRPTINGVRVSDEQMSRGWVLVRSDGCLA